MGRELKRVPLDFQWPIGKLWCGYINPHSIHECKDCNGSGYSQDYQRLNEEWYSFENSDYKPNPFKENCRYNANAWSNNLTKEDVAALLKSDRLWDFTRVPLNEEQRGIVKQKIADGGNSWLPFSNEYIPTPEEVNEWNLKTMGHDGINAWCCIKARLKREKKSHKCASCNGSGENWQHPAAKKLRKGWKDYNPPTGEGFQLWSTTTEGHPMTPVFDSLDALCQYCEDERVSAFGSSTATKEDWMRMLDQDFVFHQEGNMIFV